jgi:hypothetical protein
MGDEHGSAFTYWSARRNYATERGQAKIIVSPSGEELVVLSRRDYEDLIDAVSGQRIEAALAIGREELLTAVDAFALIKAPTPLAF